MARKHHTTAEEPNVTRRISPSPVFAGVGILAVDKETVGAAAYWDPWKLGTSTSTMLVRCARAAATHVHARAPCTHMPSTASTPPPPEQLAQELSHATQGENHNRISNWLYAVPFTAKVPIAAQTTPPPRRPEMLPTPRAHSHAAQKNPSCSSRTKGECKSHGGDTRRCAAGCTRGGFESRVALATEVGAARYQGNTCWAEWRIIEFTAMQTSSMEGARERTNIIGDMQSGVEGGERPRAW
ncbi:hypothetical protein B0H16DRAFT_933674 [Mycena metata]|uniref:Uncharacterized protein n=1 Tax=Mycena metata TaxID=1033252 RepID=A0AAD7N6X8_9AGAR|nr:hypothetical protein B0H16DRAFT_933674 [Mycena metata]